MKPTLENKVKFFAQYYGVSARVYVNITESGIPTEVNYSALHPESVECSFLLLKDASHMTAEDKEYLGLGNADSFSEYGCHYSRGGLVRWEEYEVDYLRSKGYAMRYMGESVQTFIDYNWIKLKEYA